MTDVLPALLDAGTGARLLGLGFDPLLSPALDSKLAAAIASLHQSDRAAGADVITAGTFAITDERALKAFITIAKSAAGDALVLAALGPFGDYTRRAQICVDAGADVVALETFSDHTALLTAVRETRSCSAPVWASRAAVPDAKRDAARDAQHKRVELEELLDAGASRVGLQCSSSPEVISPYLSELDELSAHVFVRPGFVERTQDATARFAKVGAEAAAAGILFGGCCGVWAADLQALTNRRIELASVPRA